MGILAICEKIPDYAKDLRTNLSLICDDTILENRLKWGTIIACAYSIGEPKLLEAAIEDAKEYLSENYFEAAKVAAIQMGMNNIYFHSIHLLKNQEYTKLRSGLRNNGATRLGIDALDYELYCFAVSALNGCEACLNDHENALIKHHVPAIKIQAALKIAATLNAAAVFLRNTTP